MTLNQKTEKSHEYAREIVNSVVMNYKKNKKTISKLSNSENASQVH